MTSRIAASGIAAALVGLRTTANNVANANTTGFRASRAEFTELMAGGEGRGVRVSRIAEQDESGEVNLTEQLLDMIKFAQQVKAQAAVIRTESEITTSVTDVLSKRNSG